MPYSQLHQISKGKLESAPPKHTNCSADLAFVPDNEFVELVWENGQILMQGQSSKARKSPSSAAFLSHISKSQEKGEGDAVTPKFDKFTAADSVLNDFLASGPSGHLGFGQEDDLVRWPNYSLEDDCSDFFSELSGDNLNGLPDQVNAVPIKDSGYGQMLRDSHMVSSHGSAHQEQRNTVRPAGEVPETTKPRSSQLRSAPLQQLETSIPSPRSRISDFSSANTNSAHHAPCWNSSQNLQFTSGLSNAKMEKQQDTGPARPPPHPSNNSSFLNFSHFLRPTLKNNLQSVRPVPCPPSSGLDRFRSNDKVSVTGSSNGVESTVIESTSGGSRSVTGYQIRPAHMAGKLDVMPPIVDKSTKEPTTIRHSETICKEDAFVKNRSSDQAVGQTSSFSASTAIGRPDNEKAAETVVASSSVCSGNSAGGASNDPKHLSKRKSWDMEESEYPSEDVEEESVAAKKPITGRVGSSTKRSRAAEVHNLSERRRRDRINEKMRALQELIPNCNKVDKASMLDEAIEYLKTLQLQVQIMSMGTGLCMPPMMLPPGMQRMHAPHMAPFSPMGVGIGMGMGMGVGFGMGMLDVGAGSSGCPLIQVPPMHGPQFPCVTMPGPSSLPMMTGPSPQMFGMPGQGLPIPRPPFVHMPGAPSTKPAPSPVASGPANVEEVRDSALHSSSKNETENLNLQMPKTSAQFSEDQIATQVTKEGFEQSAMVQKLEQNPRDSCN